ncbi:SDR family oxidoreductase [Clostridium thermopalmarium]|uniref:General stress protein 39 n=1 Tax=Clostridium thermopalmarium DSM 5974 TaxID=1121340 RepID=A0A2T0ASP5_9CLOT|nr:SDR family oxidoreductase [Clostridium thermopalmarium]PRR73258.1 General stress protein 39 [Clostridium thermopalmarium DSM 5974]PVZ25179.1 NAD(P)-dependent dehydrogenase (short-subunit alcohol dehydrogenase family) [Clostridium thermopalmarium DSM 5974]
MYPVYFQPQHQDSQPGLETLMNPRPISQNPSYKKSGKLLNKVAIITGGDSGIGKAVALAFADEGADITIAYLNEDVDAEETKYLIENKGRKCLLVKGDVSDESFCRTIVDETLKEFKHIDILVNNAGVQYPQNSITDITTEQLHHTFSTNIFSIFYLIKAALPHMKQGNTIVNTSSVTAYEGHKTLIDYSATKGAISALTRSLALNLADKGIRVNAVAPGPIWTPLIPSSFSKDEVAKFGLDTPLGRAGQPAELAPAYVYLASEDSSYVTGQVIHVNGGKSTSS